MKELKPDNRIKRRQGEGNPKRLQYLSPVSSALFALPSSALLVQPYSHEELISQNALPSGPNNFMFKSISPRCNWWLNPSGKQTAVTLSKKIFIDVKKKASLMSKTNFIDVKKAFKGFSRRRQVQCRWTESRFQLHWHRLAKLHQISQPNIKCIKSLKKYSFSLSQLL